MSDALTVDPWAKLTEAELRERCRSLSRHVFRLEQVTACLLDHYLTAYDGGYDFLATEAERLVPYWRSMKEEWQPGDEP
jgi:uncharacterized protein YaaW (UPF0174 family)